MKIVERLRHYAGKSQYTVIEDAIAEIERLRAALEEIAAEHEEYDDLAYNIAIRALKDRS